MKALHVMYCKTHAEVIAVVVLRKKQRTGKSKRYRANSKAGGKRATSGHKS